MGDKRSDCHVGAVICIIFFFKREDGIGYFCLLRGLEDVYKRGEWGWGRVCGCEWGGGVDGDGGSRRQRRVCIRGWRGHIPRGMS